MLNYVNMIYFETIGHMQIKTLKCIFWKKIFCCFLIIEKNQFIYHRKTPHLQFIISNIKYKKEKKQRTKKTAKWSLEGNKKIKSKR